MKIWCKNIYSLLFCCILFDCTLFADIKQNASINKDSQAENIQTCKCLSQEQQHLQSNKKLSQSTINFWNTLKDLLQSKNIKTFTKEINSYIKKFDIDNTNDCEKLCNFLNYQDKAGNSLLHFAVQIGDLQCVQILLKNKININLQNQEGKTAILNAVENDYYEVMLELLRNGADLEKKSKQHNDVFTEAWANPSSKCAAIMWKYNERLQKTNKM